MSNALEDFVAIVIGEFWKGEIDPARPGWWEFLEKREKKTMADEPPSFHKEDWNHDVMDARLLGGEDILTKAKNVVSEQVDDGDGNCEQNDGRHIQGDYADYTEGMARSDEGMYLSRSLCEGDLVD